MNFSSERELTGVDAMKGLKARRLLKTDEPMWDALKANRVSLPTGEVYTALQTGMINTMSTPPGSIEAYSWWEFLKYGQKPYQYYADAYIMANSTWFNGLPADLQKIIMDVGKEVGKLSTDRIMDAGESTLKKFQDRGGIITTLSGVEKAKFDKLMKDEVMPAMAMAGITSSFISLSNLAFSTPERVVIIPPLSWNFLRVLSPASIILSVDNFPTSLPTSIIIFCKSAGNPLNHVELAII